MAASTTSASLDVQVEQSLYAQRERVYPREVHGIFATMRVLAVLVLLGLFYGVLWLHWDGQQLLLFDLPARRFHIFGLTLFPQDFFFLAAIMIIGALTLFFVTALAGRLWCGYACPQTVWTEVFLWIERKIEGDRRKQMKRDKSPWTSGKVAVKATKHGIWIAFSLWTGFTFVGYFTPVLELGESVMTLDLGPWETFWVLFYGFATYGNAGWMREQVCIYMCPYARFQGAMFDKDTLVISYDPVRGEPRGARKRSTDHKGAGLGDCIDCTMCVQVCPTGIDIRDGLQVECIACAACVDACDRVMDQMGYENGLIRYTTESALSGEKPRILRTRVIVYAVILLALVSAVAYGTLSRTPLALDVIRDRNTLYRETADGLVENVYILKVINMDGKDHRFEVAASGIDGMRLDLDSKQIQLAAHEVLNVSARVSVDPYLLARGSSTFSFTLQAIDDPALRVNEEARFLGPAAQSR